MQNADEYENENEIEIEIQTGINIIIQIIGWAVAVKEDDVSVSTSCSSVWKELIRLVTRLRGGAFIYEKIHSVKTVPPGGTDAALTTASTASSTYAARMEKQRKTKDVCSVSQSIVCISPEVFGHPVLFRAKESLLCASV